LKIDVNLFVSNNNKTQHDKRRLLLLKVRA